MQRLQIGDDDFETRLAALLSDRHDPEPDPRVEARVREIIASVRSDGDVALQRLTHELDRWDPGDPATLVIGPERLARAAEAVGPRALDDLQLAADRIRRFHARQREESWSLETEDGVLLGHRTIPLRSVGVYVPGGTAAYPSSVLMNVVPARVAGVEQIVMVTPTPDARISEVVLAAAHVAGVERVIRIGGAQAVAALAFGTPSVPRVDKIVGPGNRWVAAAKRQVFGVVDIDMIAGPSELCVVATSDGGASPAHLAADLLSQAEHDRRAMVSVISPDRVLLDRVCGEVARQCDVLPRRSIAAASVADYGVAIETGTLEEAIAVAERIAPEHLELVIPNPLVVANRIRNAGAIFCGPHTPEAVGDYIAGPNHVLPTSGTARFSSALGVYDFVKRVNVIRFSRRGLAELGPAAARLADLEGLEGHARSIRLRLDGAEE